jgi:histidinol dehydrogenase
VPPLELLDHRRVPFAPQHALSGLSEAFFERCHRLDEIRVHHVLPEPGRPSEAEATQTKNLRVAGLRSRWKRSRAADLHARDVAEQKGVFPLNALRYAGAMFPIVAHDHPSFAATLERLADRGEVDFEKVEGAVRAILADVRARGDEAVRAYVERFEKRAVPELFRRDYGGSTALERLDPKVRGVLERAAERIARFHEHQKDPGFRYQEGGITLGTRTQAVDAAAIYAPGGKARYPSSVLMAAIPARIAGVREILLVTPLAGDADDDLLLASAHLAGVTGVVDAGGAQGIAAVAYGTATIPRVDKVVGPGNIYVATAKRLVFGAVSIDSIAGPSEILVLADDTANPRVVAADLLSQAEHDEAAYPLLACTSHAIAEAVRDELEAQIASLPRRAIAEASVRGQGCAIVVDGTDGLVAAANRIASEHLSIQTRDAHALADRVVRAGAIFVGHATPEAAGDYLAGPSHVLPTGGAVRFGSPLGVYDFVTRSSVVAYDAASLAVQADDITAFARLEGLEAHARAVDVRVAR